MIVQLSIADDTELRQHIKDVIKGEVVSIARGEIRKIIAEVVRDGVIPKTQEEIDRIVKDTIASEVKTQLKASAFGGDSVIKNIAREEISKYFKELMAKGILV